jgi:hypothetical protein
VQAASEGVRSIWDEYRLLGEAFRGPATVAWNAEHVISGRRARLTTVHAPPMASAVTAEAVSHAFRRAAERAREFAHPDHLSIIGIAEQAGLPVAVTMLPEGSLLSERVTEQPVPLGEAMKRVSQIAHAVAALHGLTPVATAPTGLRHGYLVPENLWLRDDGRLALLDSGIHAAAAHAAFSSGFPVAPGPYVPPGDEAFAEGNHSADVYALVALLVRLVTGRAPRPGDLAESVAGLPAVLPASLRAELMEVAHPSKAGAAPNARSLAVHLAFDYAWIRAQERTRGERDLLEGELRAAHPASEGAPESAAPSSTLRQWARAHPTAGVRGGSTQPAPVDAPGARSGGVHGVASGLTRFFSRQAAEPCAKEESVAPPQTAYLVCLGPFGDAQAALTGCARVRGAWPRAAAAVENGRHYVEVTTCDSRGRAEEVAERLRQSGEPAEVVARP